MAWPFLTCLRTELHILRQSALLTARLIGELTLRSALLHCLQRPNVRTQQIPGDAENELMYHGSEIMVYSLVPCNQN